MLYEDKNGKIHEIKPGVIASTWCVNCGKYVQAEYIYKGNGLCPKCFKEIKEYEQGEK